MAAILGITEQRLRQLVQEGMPRIGAGLYPLSACVQWNISYWKDRATTRESDTRKTDKQDLENAILRTTLEEKSGHLISRSEVKMTVSSGFVRLGKFLDSLPRSLADELNLGTDAARLIRARIDEGRAMYVRDVQEYIDVVEVEKQQAEDGNRRKKRT